MRRLAIFVAVGLGLAIALALGWVLGSRRHEAPDRPETAAAPAARYQCPMHHQIVSDRPGRCPICNMELVPVATKAGSVALDDVRRKLVGARTATVEETPFVRRIRTVGRVAFDETRMKHVHTKVQGWIEHLHAGAEGDTVRQGQALLTIYSPELLASQQEYLVALDNRARAAGSAAPGVAEDAQRLLESARRRLLLQDMNEEQIAALETTRKAERVVTLYSPVTGTITARRVSHGERVESATSLLDIADLSTVWIQAELYESDLAFVRDGQEVEITVAARPGRTYRAPIRLLSPVVEPQTRTVSARIELGNGDLALRPGMFAEVVVTSDLGLRRSVPKDAVLRTGERDIVLVGHEDATFTPREVVLGMELPDRWEVVSGLSTGERVLVAANFLIDSESKLRSIGEPR
jgi:membrane fusion protein, copper/silver efflux system